LDQSFLDPRLSEDGKPYGPKRFKDLVRECWFISDNTNTSYTDVLDLSCLERRYLINFIHEKHEATKEAIEAVKAKKSK
jgi:hypothetical protein